MILNSLLEAVGCTPVIRLSALSKKTNRNIYVKLESLNPGGSHKVRIAHAMIKDAESKGILRPGSGQTVIEPSGGNTGIGLAIICNIRGYKLKLVIPDNYSIEKQKLLKLYGADVVLSDSTISNNSHGDLAMELQLKNPTYVLLNQQRNPSNPRVHRETTAKEILDDFDETGIDAFVSGIGTGGHITGIGEILKKQWPQIKILGVEPEQCDILKNQHAPHKLQGLSIGLVPPILNVSIIDDMVKVPYDKCVDMAVSVLKTDAISMGLSSAANLVAVDKVCDQFEKGANILTMVYDGIDSYLPHFEKDGDF